MEPPRECRKKQYLVLNFVHFLQEELIGGNLNDERKESVEVAIQCLESAFELENLQENPDDKIDLLSFVTERLVGRVQDEISEERKAEAEQCKNTGNTHMKNALYQEAVNEYTKAINLNPCNAVYFCNRAAAYSRMEKHAEAINDCKEAIKLDPTYGKAYGRLGIAYSNLNRFDEAQKAYLTALKYDPSNGMYETNLKLAEERLYAEMENTPMQDPTRPGMDLGQFINNPNLINMATQMLSDPNIREMMSGIMTMTNSGDPSIEGLLQVGQTLANRMQTADPALVESLRRQMNPNAPAPTPNSSNSQDTMQYKSTENNKKPE